MKKDDCKDTAIKILQSYGGVKKFLMSMTFEDLEEFFKLRNDEL